MEWKTPQLQSLYIQCTVVYDVYDKKNKYSVRKYYSLIYATL